MKNKSLGNKPKERAEWKIGMLIALGTIIFIHMWVVYVYELCRIARLLDWGQMANNYYMFMDRMDVLFTQWMGY